MLAGLFLVSLSGCEVDSFFDPAVQGRWEKTPIVLPILEQLDIIDEPPAKVAGFSEVMPGDLEADVSEYVIGPGDTINISVFELLNPGQDYTLNKQVDELGMVRFPMIGTLRAAGKTTAQLEREIADIALKKNLIKDPTVSVTVYEGRQRTYTVVGEAQSFNSGIGTYVIPHQDFRILEAIALAHGIPGTVKRIYVIRQVQLSPTGPEAAPGVKPTPSEGAATPEELIDILNKGLESDPNQPAPAATQPDLPPPPANLGGTLDSGQADKWANVNGKWVKLDTPAPAPSATSAPAATQPVTSVQRVIEIPYASLLEGNMQYNVVVRPGDIIRIPAPVIGNIYLGGQIARPGTYGLPGEKDLNLKQAIFAAGGLTSLADAHRVDLIRRIGDDREATVRLDLKAIFDGTAPDFFLKPNDTVNFGTNFFMTPLAVMRNGFRASYGFGFILDRNFEQEVFGGVSSNN